MLSKFPLYIEGQLDICELKVEDLQLDDWKTFGVASLASWQSKFCLLKENDSKLFIFNDEHLAQQQIAPNHMNRCRLDNELSCFRIGNRFIYSDDEISADLTNKYNKKYGLNPSHSQPNQNKIHSRGGLFRNGSRFFSRGKNSSKFISAYQSNKGNNLENNQSQKNVMIPKRTLSVNKINRKKSEERSFEKCNSSNLKKTPLSQSTGDLTVIGTSPPIIIHYLDNDTIISEIHSSLVGGRPHCFSVRSVTEEMDLESSLDKKPMNTIYTTRLFAASSNLEKQCWIKRLQQTLKPNLENENRVNNSLRITIFESKSLPLQKRRYYCTVIIDKNLYAKTTSKLSDIDGSVFWAEEIILNNVPNFKNLSIALYKEPESTKDVKRIRKKKCHNQCIGQINFTFSSLNGKSEFQSWNNLKSSDLPFDRGLNNPAQLRVKLRLLSLKVLKTVAYSRLHEVIINNYKKFIKILEKNLPIKLKEEIAICLVNLHEKNGSIIQFIIDLISEEINDIEDSSMTLRANTIVTKIIEYHMRLVGSQYLNETLYPFIHDVLYKGDTVEVDPSRYDSSDEHKANFLQDNQTALIGYLRLIWYRIYDSRNSDFPKQLKSVFAGWRQKLTSQVSEHIDREAIESHCDVIVSGCIFLRLLCPAILSPYLFGLVTHLSEKSAVQRTLTLVAKSLQSLANFSKFGEKERFMTFMNDCFEEEIPRMKDFLRCISSEPVAALDEDERMTFNKEIHYYGVPVDQAVQLASLYNCLMSDAAKERIDNSPLLENNVRLSDVVDEITEQLKSFIVTPSTSTLKKISNIRSIGHRRTLSTQLLNTTDLDKSSSTPLMGSPVKKSSESHIFHQHFDDIYDTPCFLNKNVTTNSTTPQQSPDNSLTQRVNIIPERRVGYKARNGESQSTFLSYVTTDSQLNSSISKNLKLDKPSIIHSSSRIPPQKPPRKNTPKSHYSKVNDTATIKPSFEKIDMTDIDFYKENPIYGIVFGSSTIKFLPDPCDCGTNLINKYFTVRTHIKEIKNEIKESICGEQLTKNNQLPVLYEQLEAIKKEIHSEQLNDLKQLQTMLNFNKAGTTLDRSQLNSASDSITSDALDEVLNSISFDEACLDKAQESLRRLNTSPKVKPKPMSLRTPRSINSQTTESRGDTVAFDILDLPLQSPDSPPNRAHSTSSSNHSFSLKTASG